MKYLQIQTACERASAAFSIQTDVKVQLRQQGRKFLAMATVLPGCSVNLAVTTDFFPSKAVLRVLFIYMSS